MGQLDKHEKAAISPETGKANSDKVDSFHTEKLNFVALSQSSAEIAQSPKAQKGDAHLSRALDLMSAEHEATTQQKSIAAQAREMSTEGLSSGQSWHANRLALEKAGMTDVPHGNAADIKSIPHMTRMPDGTALQPGDVVTMGKHGDPDSVSGKYGSSFIVGRDPESSKTRAFGTSESEIPDLKGKDVSIFRATAADALMKNAADNAKDAIVSKANEVAHDGEHLHRAGKAVRDALAAAGIHIPLRESADIKTPENMQKLPGDTPLRVGDVVVVGKQRPGSSGKYYDDSFVVGENNTALGSHEKKIPDLQAVHKSVSIDVYRLKEQ